MQRDYACHRNELKTGVAFSKKIHGPCPCKTVISVRDYVISHDFDNGDVISSSHNMLKHTLKIILYIAVIFALPASSLYCLLFIFNC